MEDFRESETQTQKCSIESSDGQDYTSRYFHWGRIFHRVGCGLPHLIRKAGMSDWLEEPAVAPELNRPRAVFVGSKIDEILAREKNKEEKRQTRFVE